jgi:hypothetical protein
LRIDRRNGAKSGAVLSEFDSAHRGPYYRSHASAPAKIIQFEPPRHCLALLARVPDPQEGQVLGDVEAPSREAAEAEAVRTFNLSPEQRSRLVLQERG